MEIIVNTSDRPRDDWYWLIRSAKGYHIEHQRNQSGAPSCTINISEEVARKIIAAPNMDAAHRLMAEIMIEAL